MVDEEEDLIKELEEDIEREEDQSVEFKGEFPEQADDLGEEIAAFSSTNQGRIYLGVDDDGNIQGLSESWDDVQGRVSGIQSNNINPTPLPVVDVKKIEKNGKLIARIDVPKGKEPLYFVNYRPYIRKLNSSRPATPEEVKEIYRKFFEHQVDVEKGDEEQQFLIKVLNQLSDFQILWFDHENRGGGPDFKQLMYNMEATGKALQKLSYEEEATNLQIEDDLKETGENLEDISHHQLYIDGGKSWKEFKRRGNQALEEVNNFMDRIKKRTQINENMVEEIISYTSSNIKELNNIWSKKDKYRERANFSKLKNELRTLGYSFNRLSNVPPTSEKFQVQGELKEIAEILRKISSDKYFRVGMGNDPIEEIENYMERCINISEKVAEMLDVNTKS